MAKIWSYGQPNIFSDLMVASIKFTDEILS